MRNLHAERTRSDIYLLASLVVDVVFCVGKSPTAVVRLAALLYSTRVRRTGADAVVLRKKKYDVSLDI